MTTSNQLRDYVRELAELHNELMALEAKKHMLLADAARDGVDLDALAKASFAPPGRSSSRPCVVYFARNDTSGEIKIGMSTEVTVRMSGIAAATGHSVTLLATTPGARLVEHMFHDAFAVDRLQGEWFRPSASLMATIDAIARLRAA